MTPEQKLMAGVCLEELRAIQRTLQDVSSVKGQIKEGLLVRLRLWLDQLSRVVTEAETIEEEGVK